MSATASPRRGVIETYRSFLPDVDDATPVVTLYEGGTPLIEAPRLAAWITAGSPRAVRLRLYLKFEGMNPTGSFKDRGMTMAVSKAAQRGAKVVLCASTGNTSAAAAAYAARAGMACVVFLPRGEVALGKLSQALMHGARVFALDGNFDDALTLAREISKTHPIELVNSVNPVRIEGQKTAAFEIVDALGDAPDFHAIPVGNAGNITAYWRGYREYENAGRARRLPRMLGFQAAGAAPLVDGAPVREPKTLATAIRIGNPASWESAVAAQRESDGLIDKVTDAQILEAYAALARTEGVFAEPASVAPVAGLKMLAERGFFAEEGDGGASIAVTLTGHGLKDPDRAISASANAIVELPAQRDALLSAIDDLIARSPVAGAASPV